MRIAVKKNKFIVSFIKIFGTLSFLFNLFKRFAIDEIAIKVTQAHCVLFLRNITHRGVIVFRAICPSQTFCLSGVSVCVWAMHSRLRSH